MFNGEVHVSGYEVLCMYCTDTVLVLGGAGLITINYRKRVKSLIDDNLYDNPPIEIFSLLVPALHVLERTLKVVRITLHVKLLVTRDNDVVHRY